MAEDRLKIFRCKSVSALQDCLTPLEIKDEQCAEAYKSFIKDEVHNADTAEMWSLLRQALQSDNQRLKVLEDIVDLVGRGMVKGMDADVQKRLQEKNAPHATIEDAYKHLNSSFDGDGTRAAFDKEVQKVIDEKSANKQSLKERERRKCSLM